MSNLFQELKRRKVFRVAAVYVVVAWLLIQVADTITPALALPEWTTSLVTVLLGLGLIPSMILAWAYETTPAGIKPDALVQPAEGLRATSAQPINYLILVIVILVAGFQVVDRFAPAENQVSSPTEDISVTSNFPTQLSVNFEDDVTFRAINGGALGLALSSDGTQLVFTGYYADGRGRQLLHRSLDKRELVPIPGTEQAHNPFFSADNESIGFFTSEGLIKRVTFDGRQPTTITDGASQFSKGIWADARIYFVSGGRLKSVSVEGGTSVDLTPDNLGPSTIIPSLGFIPQTGELLVGLRFNDENELILLDPDSGETESLLENAKFVGYIEAGFLIFLRDGNLMAARFDVTSRRVGFPVPVLDGYSWDEARRTPQVSISGIGTLSFAAEFVPDLNTNLYRIGLDGDRERIAELSEWSAGINISPDGRYAAISTDSTPYRIYVWDMMLQVPTGVEFENASSPSWHPDSRRIIFTKNREIVAVNIEDGSEEVLFGSQGGLGDPSFGPDGKTLVFHASDQNGDRGIFALMPEEDSPRPIIITEQNSENAQISPNGQWVAYQSESEGFWAIYVARFPSGTQRRRVSVASSWYPTWSSDGKKLYFQSGLNPGAAIDMYMVEAESEDLQTFTAPEFIFNVQSPEEMEQSRSFLNWGTNYDVSEDGSEFYIVYGPATHIVNEIVISQNWITELERMLPSDRF